MADLLTICENCGEHYSNVLLPSDINNNKIETYCPKCGFSNEDDFYDKKESNI